MSLSPSKYFLEDYMDFVRSCQSNDHRDNYDVERFGPSTMAPLPLIYIRRALGALRRGRLPKALQNLQAALTGNTTPIARDLVEPAVAQWNWLYGRLADDESRSLLIKLLAYRALGHRKVKLPLSTPEYWNAFSEAGKYKDNGEKFKTEFMSWDLNRYNLSPLGFPLSVYTRQTNILTDFMICQYRGRVDSGDIKAEKGDTVIDAGACWGDTALHFAHEVGPTGRVISFEFLPANVETFQRNVNANRELCDRIELVRHPLWSVAGKEVHVTGSGPAARVADMPTSSSLPFVTTTIDDVVRAREIDRVDYIKMDIEGAELDALKGARETLLGSRPKLAVCLYHRLSDFWTIPCFLDKLNCGYEFYIRHFTIHAEETVLFALAR